MEAGTVALVVLLTISLVLNFAAFGFLLMMWKRKPSQEYEKVEQKEKDGENVKVEANVKNELAPRRSDEKIDKLEVKPKVESVEKKESHVLRSVENDLRSQDGQQRRRAPQERSDRQRLQEPIGNDEFSKSMKSVVRFVNDYFDDSHKLPVVPNGDVSSSLRIQKALPEKSEGCGPILKDIRELVLPNVSHTQHPRFHAKFAGKSLADVVAMTISTSLSIDRAASPAIESIERVLAKWLTDALAIPRMGQNEPQPFLIYSPREIYVATIRRAIQNHDDGGGNDDAVVRGPFVVYASDDANFAIEAACRHVSSPTNVKLRRVVTSSSSSSSSSAAAAMTSHSLEKQMAKDVARGMRPLLVVANYGSTMVAANDEIWDLVKTAKSKNVWLHVDASYAGCEWIDENHRNNVHALLSDVTSCHVTFNTLFPYAGNVSIVWSGGGKLEPDVRPSESEDPLRFWILCRLFGFRSIRESVRRKIALGNAFAERISQHADFFDVQYGNEHGVVVFQYRNKTIKNRAAEDVNRMTSLFYNYITATSSALKFAVFRFHTKTLIRGVVNCERTNSAQMEESVSALVNCVDEFEEAFKKRGGNSLTPTPIVDFSQSIGGSPNETTEKTQSWEG